MPKAKKTKAKKPAPKNYLVFTSECGKPEQAEFAGAATTCAAAEKLAQKSMKPDGCGNIPRSVYVCKIEKTGTVSTDMVWA